MKTKTSFLPKWKVLLFTLCLFSLFLFSTNRGFSIKLPAEYQSLNPEQKALAVTIMKSQYVYDCCDKSIYACLQETPICRLSLRLAGQICHQIQDGIKSQDIERSLSLRAMTAIGTDYSREMDLSRSAKRGKEQCPVKLVIYTCMRCPFCSRLVPEIHKLLEDPELKNKIQIILQIFPVKGHEYSVEGGLAYLAAQNQGKGWEYMLKAYQNFQHFQLTDYERYAKELGLNMEQFQTDIQNPETKNRLADYKTEGLSIGVEATPTFYINGKKYMTNLETWLMKDILLEEYDRLSNRNY